MTYSIKNLTSTLFIDVETVSEVAQYSELSPIFKELWDKKGRRLLGSGMNYDDAKHDLYKNNAAIYAEFGKIICISAGYITSDGHLRVKSFAGHDEAMILEEFAVMVTHHFDDPKAYFFCGHNLKEFDIPYICRRMIKHGVSMPNMLDIAGKRPWQTEHLLDTLDMWRFGDIKGYTSLALICAVLDIESPKNDIDGSMVGKVYWEDKDLERICKYCAHDVVATVKVMLKFLHARSLDEDQIEILEWKEGL
ncbi:MAG: ribonuclease H-like domain-containing protein [Saprospiraceae bacterium]|nr:ribonuclease H-like domain-containing protein [Saprospiraceae bacterium]